jgi:hypothetical protein
LHNQQGEAGAEEAVPAMKEAVETLFPEIA